MVISPYNRLWGYLNNDFLVFSRTLKKKVIKKSVIKQLIKIKL